jgi:Na+/phosphate symporter
MERMDEPLESDLTTPVVRKTAASETGRAGLAQALLRLVRRVHVGKIALFIVSLFLFILAITLMKEGAKGLAPLVQDVFRVDSPANALGFGWLFAYLIMSGSPVAAAALTFFDAGVLDQYATYAMISGSRLGASFIVLLIGFIYVLRGRNRAASLSMGLLSLSVTGLTQVVSLFLGLTVLRLDLLPGVQFRSAGLLSSITDLIFDPVITFFSSFLPEWALFLVGLGIILVSFNLFDRCLPEMTIKESQVGRVSRLVYRPWVMFVLGAAVTMISMSISVSLAILVPLSNRGFVRRENVIPYIMGASVTTFIDTLFAAMLLENPQATAVVMAQMMSITLVSFAILALFYGRFERGNLAFVGRVTDNGRDLVIFVAAIVIVPIVLLLL